MATVLIVDDEVAIVSMLVSLVEDYGHIGLSATNGLDALRLAHTHKPELIISDVMMPLMDGYDLLQALRADESLSNTSVFLMSAASFDRFVRQPVSSPDGFIPKPFDISTIDHILQSL